MRPETTRALRAQGRRFYVRHAAGFAGSRRQPWEGWARALAEVVAPRRSLHVLDAGCGHGRLAAYLAGSCDASVDYLGIDSCLPLLDLGTHNETGTRPDGRLRCSLVAADLMRELPLAGAVSSFDLIALFGVLHHVPGQSARRDLIRRLAARLAPGGRLVFTIWRVERQPRFAAKRVAWQDYNRCAAVPVDPSDLEPGDHLLVWGDDRDVPRYCHAMSDAEAEELIAASDLELADRFESDGPNSDWNLYVVLASSGRSPSAG